QATDFIKSDVFKLAAQLITEPSDEIPNPDQRTRRMARPTDSSRSFESIDDARFIPGEVLLDRYRIVGLLGRGGMGEVYRADDLKLKQPVALKFLPAAVTLDGAALARFYKEVSVARQISHRHVCRVYDVGEYRGEHFLSMEFVRGEELSSLLKRIGRLPQDKAIDVARQLCAGLAAVHDRGVLHRDLKPQNIMLDERGEVRITDFGIAALASEVRGREAMAGTPAYMSPEQLDGAEVTTKSDIYSLGLVLYELFTGKKAFNATSLAELISLRRSGTTPTSPAELVPDLDPLVERVIFRCLARDPAKRPASALQVAAALPGGDPLAAALAAGETPSPEMVAAAPKEGGLKPAIALALLVTALGLIAANSLLAGRVTLFHRVPLNKPPEVLRDRAAELVKKFGHTSPPGDSAYGMGLDRDYLDYINANDSSASRWDQLNDGQPASIYFWYRTSSRAFDVAENGYVTESKPALVYPEMITLTLDTVGRLRSFEAVPPQRAPVEAKPTDWSIVFLETGLDQSKFQSVAPTWTSPREATERVAWEGPYPDRSDLKIRVEAGSYDGKLVYFELFEPWDQITNNGFALSRFRQRALIILLLGSFIIVLLGSALLAWRNARMGRGDRKGAFRVAVFVFFVSFIHWLFTAHHTATTGEVFNFLTGIQNQLFWATFFWVVYMAFEPFVRRRWPGRIISWSRVLAGGFRDPLVGRDILIGAVFGWAIIAVNFILPHIVLAWFGQPPRIPWFDFPATQLLGIRSFVRGLTNQTYGGLFQGFMLLFVLLLFFVILRRERLATLALWLLAAVALSLTHETPAAIPFAFVGAGLLIWVLYRYGLLALIVADFVVHFVIFFPITSDLTAWYAGDFVLALIVTLGLIAFGFYTSLAGQPLFRGAFPDE
ncbi:MAG TPA: serine/threonine-protein kinase, partial [Pyrinomonadaceae bacterium]|nr:serine/threonine-protein kinase [Pyrinomonadaceae bacterium]